jgi:hypothetical protein
MDQIESLRRLDEAILVNTWHRYGGYDEKKGVG